MAPGAKPAGAPPGRLCREPWELHVVGGNRIPRAQVHSRAGAGSLILSLSPRPFSLILSHSFILSSSHSLLLSLIFSLPHSLSYSLSLSLDSLVPSFSLSYFLSSPPLSFSLIPQFPPEACQPARSSAPKLGAYTKKPPSSEMARNLGDQPGQLPPLPIKSKALCARIRAGLGEVRVLSRTGTEHLCYMPGLQCQTTWVTIWAGSQLVGTRQVP